MHFLRSDELGIVYQSVLQELESRNITLPTPLDSRSPTPEFLKHLSSREMPNSSDSSTSSLGGGFERGLDFCQLLTDRSPPPAPRTPTMQQSKAFTARTGNGVAMTVSSTGSGMAISALSIDRSGVNALGNATDVAIV